MRTLLPPYAHPRPHADPDPDTTVVVDAPERTGELGAAATLGYVDLEFGARSLAEVLTEVDRWATYPVVGLFFDQAPTSAYAVGPVALALRVSRRRGLHRLVLNPGAPAHPLYRELGVAICTFEGSWLQYQRWTGEGTRPGDGHLVHGVPTAHLPAARHLLAWRQAGFGLATDAVRPRR
jgi:hypothetical protein